MTLTKRDANLSLDLDCSTAIFSDDRRYRYELRRRWGDGPWLLWVLLNPSTADEHLNDPTVTKLVRWSRLEWASKGYGGLILCNLFGWRATSPKDLFAAENKGIDIVGKRNNDVLCAASREAPDAIVGWGVTGSYVTRRHGRLEKRDRRVASMLTAKCFGYNNDGTPKHPLYLPYSEPLELFTYRHPK
jgi:hypothetical protein